MDELNNHAEEKKAGKKKWLFIGFALAVCIVAGYYGWQWKQTNDYHAQITPLYRNCESIEQDINNILGKGGRYVDLMDEAKRTSKATKELKARFAETAPQTAKAVKTQTAFIAMMEAQIDRADALLRYLQSDLTVITKDDYIKSTSSNYYLRRYSSEYIEKAEQEREAARLKRDSAKWEMSQFSDKYVEEKTKIVTALSIKDAKGLLPNGSEKAATTK